MHIISAQNMNRDTSTVAPIYVPTHTGFKAFVGDTHCCAPVPEKKFAWKLHETHMVLCQAW